MSAAKKINIFPVKDFTKSCDYCQSQCGSKHYCNLHGMTVKNMDIVACKDWEPLKEMEDLL